MGDAFGEEKPAEKPEKAPKAKPAPKVEPEKSAAEQMVDNKRETKLYKAVEFANAAKCAQTCSEGAASPAVLDLINQALAKLEAAIAIGKS